MLRGAIDSLGFRPLFLSLCLLVSLAGCAGAPPAGSPAAGSLAAGARGSVSLDDVTNGLVQDEFGTNTGGWSRSLERSTDQSSFVDTDDGGLPDMRMRSGAETQRMLIYRGSLQLEVARAEEACRLFLAKVEERGGYLQSQSGTELTVRVPAAHFDELFLLARGVGRVLAETRNAKDVTEEFVDLGLRVDNARKSRERLLEVLKVAKKVEDILKVESELRRLTEEIERMEGRLKFLRDQVAMSTLEVGFRSVQVAPKVRRGQRLSRFGWINRVGADAVMRGF